MEDLEFFFATSDLVTSNRSTPGSGPSHGILRQFCGDFAVCARYLLVEAVLLEFSPRYKNSNIANFALAVPLEIN